jgi:hypothetical protein
MSAPTIRVSSFKRFVLLLSLGLAMTVATGLVYGHLSQRWGPAPDLVAAGKHVETLPAQIADWQLVREEPMQANVIAVLSCAGYVNRQYVNRSTGDTIHIAITVGPSGPISVHTPEICYSSRAYSVQEPRQLVILPDKDGGQHSYWRVSFRSNNSFGDQLRVYYAWASQKTWKAAKSPRFEFAGRPILHKLQISSLVTPERAAEADDPCKAFLADMLRSGWKTES